MQTKYDPQPVEEKWYKFWEDKGYFRAEVDRKKKPYCVVIPPPNITGSLHMGHALNNTLQDILVRWKRMQGYQSLWIPGADHAGIAAQNVVEKSLLAQGMKNRHQLGREKFEEKVWEWKKEYGDNITYQLRKLGSSCDWSRQRFTLDEGCSRAVREEFVRLYEEGLIYQANYIINWCPRCCTALSDIEVEHEETKGYLYYINYPLENGKDQITVATTRPETMLGDTAVAVHPDDKRYQRLIGKELVLPLVGRRLPIIADESVDAAFGTGAVKITPAHDHNDFEIGLKHNLLQIIVIDETGKIIGDTGRYAGMDRYQCREEILKDLKKKSYLVKEEEYVNAVGHCYRCQTVTEPLVSEQWFVKMKELARPAIRAVKKGKVNFIPGRWTKVYLNWMDNIRDWCISRQIWWGHRLPVWHCQDCKHINVDRTEPEKCQKCNSSNLEQDTNVLDTWFSSALWPLSTLGWPEDTEDLNYFYPTATLITGYEIIYFWVARMIMMGLKFKGDVPFQDVYIHGIVRDNQGRKMSKSLGNVIDPLDLIKRYGTDALRFSLSQATTLGGQDIFLNEDKVEGMRNFANKLWNVSRFIMMNTEDFNFREVKPETLKFDEDDEYIIGRLDKVTKNVTDYLSSCRFSEAGQAVYEFLWHEFCDWYVEFTKLRLYDSETTREDKQTAKWVLHYVLRNVLKLLHPYMPFITEEIWQYLAPEENSIMVSSWPEPGKVKVNKNSIQVTRKKYEVIVAERRIRSCWNIPPGNKLEHFIKPVDDEEKKVLDKNDIKLKKMLSSSSLTIDKNYQPQGKLGSEVTPSGTTIFVNLGEGLDLDKEIKRQEKEISKLEKELEKLEKKLGSSDFLEKAPKEIIEKNKKKKNEYETRMAQLRENLEKIK